MKKLWERLRANIKKVTYIPTPIVADAAVATSLIGEGRIIPLVILDTSSRADVEDFIHAHETLPAGDVNTQWARPEGDDSIVLLCVEFERPAQLLLVLNFSTAKQDVLVDLILRSKGLYIQAGRPGDRFVNTLNNPRILIEVPDTDFKPVWEAIWTKALIGKFRASGLARAAAKRAAKEYIETVRQTSSLRMNYS